MISSMFILGISLQLYNNRFKLYLTDYKICDEIMNIKALL